MHDVTVSVTALPTAAPYEVKNSPISDPGIAGVQKSSANRGKKREVRRVNSEIPSVLFEALERRVEETCATRTAILSNALEWYFFGARRIASLSPAEAVSRDMSRLLQLLVHYQQQLEAQHDTVLRHCAGSAGKTVQLFGLSAEYADFHAELRATREQLAAHLETLKRRSDDMVTAAGKGPI